MPESRPIIHAPALTTLSSLGWEWRQVATADGTTIWLGDLSDRRNRDRFMLMRDRGHIVTVRGKSEVFAKISQDITPADAHARALASQERAETCRAAEDVRAKRRYVKSLP